MVTTRHEVRQSRFDKDGSESSLLRSSWPSCLQYSEKNDLKLIYSSAVGCPANNDIHHWCYHLSYCLCTANIGYKPFR